MTREPLLSIVIPAYNAARFLGDCLGSLRDQIDDDIEVIVRDGNSSDSTSELIHQFSDVVAHFESRPDFGQGDAMDRGFQAATGRFLTWLNADDVMMPGAIAAIRRAVAAEPTVEWWVGDTVLLDVDGQVTGACRAGQCIYGRYLRFVMTYGPSSLFSRRLYEQTGGLDLSFHYMMDTDLWHRFAAAGHRYSRIPHYLWGFRQHDESKTTG
ncbi:MAG TPA: glycosyltransferase family 2 protein, partial [Polyangiaceae bacterium]|nr:glycosyltransferase family 2 protein [Polyangiaceae bacterium]